MIKKSLSSVILLGILCCTACGNSSNIAFLENNEEELEDIYSYESNGSPLLTEGDTLILALVNKNLKGLDGDFWAITAEAYGKFYETADKSYKRIIDDSESATYSYEELQNVFR